MVKEITNSQFSPVAFLLGLIILMILVIEVRMQPVSVNNNMADNKEFSAVKAKDTLAYVLGDQTPHPVDSAASRAVQKRITELLTIMGYEVEVQDTISCRKYGQYSCARVRNLIVQSKGTQSSGSILLSAHYDSVAAAPGASDAGSAVATLLEIARMLKEREPGKNNVIFLFNEGEEVALLGAHGFMEHHPLAKDIKLAINIEARGTSGQSILFETGENSGWLLDLYAQHAKRPTTNSLFSEVYKYLPNDTDLTLYKKDGRYGLNFAYAEQYPYYHTSKDNLEELDLRSLQHHGDNVYDVLLPLLDYDLSQVNSGNLVITDVLGFGVISWPEAYSPIIAGLLLVLFIAAAWRVKRHTNYGIGSLIKGMTVFILSLAIAGTFAYLLNTLMTLLNGYVTPWHSEALANRLALWALIFFAVSMFYAFMGRSNNVAGSFIGIWLTWSLVALAVSFFLPGASYLFIIPLFIATITLWFTPLLTQRLEMLGWWISYSLPATVALLIFLPVVYYLEIMLGFAGFGPVVMGIFLGIAFTAIAPKVMATSKQIFSRPLIVGLASLCFVTISWSVLSPSYSEDRPQAINVYYVQDENNNARVAIGSRFNPPLKEVLDVMGSEVEVKDVFPWSTVQLYSKQLASAKLDGIRLTPIDQKVGEEGREVTFRIESNSKPQNILFFVPKEAQLQSITYSGEKMDFTNNRNSGEYDRFSCRGESCIGEEVKFYLLNHQPVEIVIGNGILGIPESLNEVKNARDIGGVAAHGGDESYVISRIKL